MIKERYEALQATFPWRHRIIQGGVVQVVDKDGNEVALLDMVEFLDFITARLTPKEKPNETT